MSSASQIDGHEGCKDRTAREEQEGRDTSKWECHVSIDAKVLWLRTATAVPKPTSMSGQIAVERHHGGTLNCREKMGATMSKIANTLVALPNSWRILDSLTRLIANLLCLQIG